VGSLSSSPRPSGPYLALSSDDLLSDRGGHVAVAEKLGANEVVCRVLVEQEEFIAVLVLKLAELLARGAGRGIHKAHVTSKPGILEGPVNEMELAAVVVGTGVCAKGGAGVVPDKNIELITVVDGFIKVTELTAFAAVFRAINTAQDRASTTLVRAGERVLVTGVTPLVVGRVGAGRTVAARRSAARAAIGHVGVVGEPSGGQAVVHCIAGVVARAQGVGAVPLKGSVDGMGAEKDERDCGEDLEAHFDFVGLGNEALERRSVQKSVEQEKRGLLWTS